MLGSRATSPTPLQREGAFCISSREFSKRLDGECRDGNITFAFRSMRNSESDVHFRSVRDSLSLFSRLFLAFSGPLRAGQKRLLNSVKLVGQKRTALIERFQGVKLHFRHRSFLGCRWSYLSKATDIPRRSRFRAMWIVRRKRRIHGRGYVFRTIFMTIRGGGARTESPQVWGILLLAHRRRWNATGRLWPEVGLLPKRLSEWRGVVQYIDP